MALIVLYSLMLVLSGGFLAWLYTDSGKKWLKSL